jgi:hypothetical protein
MGDEEMKRFIRLYWIGVAAALAAPAALAQGPGCATAQFAPGVVARFPNVRAACMDVIERGGQQYAVIKADLVRTANNAVFVRFKRSDGSRSDTQKVTVKPDFRVQINGTATRVSDLAVGQELTAYVKVSEPVFALAPAVDAEPLETAPIEAAPPVLASNEAAMPHTASALPVVAMFGIALLGMAGMLRAARRRRQS